MTHAEVDDRADMVGVRRDPGREHGCEQHQHDDGETNQGGGIAAETAPAPRRHRGRAQLGGARDCGGGHARAPRIRTRGSTKPTNTSITRLATTKKRPEIITTPMTAFRSFCKMLRTP